MRNSTLHQRIFQAQNAQKLHQHPASNSITQRPQEATEIMATTLQTLPVELVMVIVEHLPVDGLVKLRETMNKTIVEATLSVFARTAFGDPIWQQKVLSRRTLEVLEGVAKNIIFAKQVTMLDIDVSFPQVLRKWWSQLQSSAEDPYKVDKDNAEACAKFIDDEELFWDAQNPCSPPWSRLAKAFMSLTGLTHISVLGFVPKFEECYPSASIPTALHWICEKYNIKKAPELPNMQGLPTPWFQARAFAFAICWSRRPIEAISMVPLGDYGPTIFRSVSRFHCSMFAWCSSDDRVADLNCLLEGMPQLTELKITGDLNHDQIVKEIVLEDVEWPATLTALELHEFRFEDKNTGFLRNLPQSCSSLSLHHLEVWLEVGYVDAKRAWISGLIRSVPPQITFLSIKDILCLCDVGIYDFLPFPKMSEKDPLRPYTLQVELSWGRVHIWTLNATGEHFELKEEDHYSHEEYTGPDVGKYLQSLLHRVR
jgi:hypothetical protein